MARQIEAAYVWLLCLFVSHDVIVIIDSIPLSLMSLRKLVVTISDLNMQ